MKKQEKIMWTIVLDNLEFKVVNITGVAGLSLIEVRAEQLAAVSLFCVLFCVLFCILSSLTYTYMFMILGAQHNWGMTQKPITQSSD